MPLALKLVGHVEVIQSMLPRQLLDNIRPQEVEANVEKRRKTFFVANIHKIRQQFLSDFCRGRCGGGNHRILEQLILLGE